MDDDAERIESSQLCPLCQGINIEALSAPNGYSHVSDVTNLLERGKECSLCSSFGYLLDDSVDTFMHGTISPWSERGTVLGGSSLRLSLGLSPAPSIKLTVANYKYDVLIPIRTLEGIGFLDRKILIELTLLKETHRKCMESQRDAILPILDHSARSKWPAVGLTTA